LRNRFGSTTLPDAERAPNASITRILWESNTTPQLLELASTRHLPKERRTQIGLE
jgi:hypothetical protein